MVTVSAATSQSWKRKTHCYICLWASVFFQFSDIACADRGHPKRDLGVNGDKFVELV
jgi:hypothetical protein